MRFDVRQREDLDDIVIICTSYGTIGGGKLYIINNKEDSFYRVEPHMDDVFIGFKVEGNIIKAYTWGGFEYTISLDTREIISKRFTK